MTEVGDLLSVIVLTRDRPDFFGRCSKALAASADAPVLERIVVQHGKDAETLQIAERDGWRVVAPGRNGSFSQGNNLAAREAQGQYLLLLNNDALVEPGTLSALWALRDHRLVGCLVVNSESGLVTHQGGGFEPEHQQPVHTGRGELRPEAYEHDLRAYWVTFCCVLIEAQLWRELGGLDEGFWYGYEDVDFCLRARELGVRPMVSAGARVVHDELGTRTGIEDRTNAKRFHDRWMLTGRLATALEGGL